VEILQYKLISTPRMDSADIQYSQVHQITRRTWKRAPPPADLLRQGLRLTMPTPCPYRTLTDERKPVIAGDNEDYERQKNACWKLLVLSGIMVNPRGFRSFRDALRCGEEIYHTSGQDLRVDLARQVDSVQFQPRQNRTCGWYRSYVVGCCMLLGD
jgi:hypothetical protein